MQKRLRFADLVALGVVNNRVTLGNWIRDRGFPPGQLTGPNSRTWAEGDVERWIARRPVAAKKNMPTVTRRPGRPRKERFAETQT